MKFLKKKAREALKYKSIQVTSRGSYIGNRKCHINSLSFARNNPGAMIISCIQIFEDSYPIAHFIVKKDGKYFDPTMGNMIDLTQKYLFVKEMSPEIFEPINELIKAKKNIHKQMPWYIRIIMGYDKF